MPAPSYLHLHPKAALLHERNDFERRIFMFSPIITEITCFFQRSPIFYWTITKGRVEMNRISLVTFCTVGFLTEKSWTLKCDGWQNSVVPSSWNGKTTARQPIFKWIGRDILSKVSINSHSCEARMRMRLAPSQKNSRQPKLKHWGHIARIANPNFTIHYSLEQISEN